MSLNRGLEASSLCPTSQSATGHRSERPEVSEVGGVESLDLQEACQGSSESAHGYIT